ncbi:hypothetical protein V6N13_070291 [Hibiscus sabdariffa]
MSGTISSNTPAEGSNTEPIFKRQPEVDDETSDLAVKKPKTQPSGKEKLLDIEADVAEDKGTRHSMEDAWVIMLDAILDSPGKLRCGHFAIYDGHGGRLAAEYAQKHLHANVLSAGLPRELAGGTVSSNGRLQGRLEVSRAFGDRQFKKVGVVATPEIHSFDLTDKERFIILGCDGLWGVFGPSDAVEFVQKLLKEGLPVTVVSRRLVREAVRERQCKDNCTAIVIIFRHKKLWCNGKPPQLGWVYLNLDGGVGAA